MNSSDWQPMNTAPMNPYGKAYGPTVLIWCRADNLPWPCFYSPLGNIQDNGPRWVIQDRTANVEYIDIEDAGAWMPIAAPEWEGRE